METDNCGDKYNLQCSRLQYKEDKYCDIYIESEEFHCDLIFVDISIHLLEIVLHYAFSSLSSYFCLHVSNFLHTLKVRLGRINSIYIYVLSWVRAYLRDDYKSQFKFTCACNDGKS